MHKKLKLCVTIAAVLAIGGAVGLYRQSTPAQPTQTSAGTAAPAIQVAVATATQADMPNTLAGIGELEATRQVMVTAESGGLVRSIAFQPGERVKAGQTLVQLNDAPEQGELARLQAQAANAKAQLLRTQRLLPQQAATQEELDQVQSAYSQALADIVRIKALIDQKRIKAPFTGVLGVRKVNLGQFVQAGDAMVSLTDAQTLYANITLPERALAQLKTGQEMSVSVDAYPQRLFMGHVSTLEPRIDPGTRTVLVQATLANPDNLLSPGMYANGEVHLPAKKDVISVPETAVSYSAYGDFVYVFEGADTQLTNTVRQVYVKTGERSDGRVVLLDGVKAGDRVVTSGQLRLSSGALVRIALKDTVGLDQAASR
ncbi:MAG: efflux RND transporter periplasmic adaptor subunit [Pseudomonas protegens]|uniref:efflux RND transporter periplasmic adaptor subunit n=1 Tax=Pseudomonas protegens TaxID=380021 RepID=UPI00069EE99C|nr:efflux RND transporter periplasmic adaptor subunit [Pseudomonas protegens]MDX9685883.1 efflux RND transporter periplasmic adaptor subunit [Pseudomonas protegens]